MRHLIILIPFFLLSCFNSFNDKQRVERDKVEYVEIRKQFDTVSIRLSGHQIDNFVSKWNGSSPKGPYKFLPDYFLTVYFKGDSTLSFRTSSDLIKQKSDWSYSVSDENFFQEIWLRQNGLTNEYFEYFPTYFKNDEFSKDGSQITDVHRQAIKRVLTFYNHKWKDIRGQIFFQGKIDNELLCNYTTKANDSIWLETHK